jgi:hypothetical protein
MVMTNNRVITLIGVPLIFGITASLVTSVLCAMILSQSDITSPFLSNDACAKDFLDTRVHFASTPSFYKWFSKYRFGATYSIASAVRVNETEMKTVFGEVVQHGSNLEIGPTNWVLHLSVGWPLRATEGELYHIEQCESTIHMFVIPISSKNRLQILVPYGIIPLKFMANVLFFSVLWQCVVSFFKSLRRALRARAHCCIACGYSMIGGSRICPECGKASYK